MASTKPDLSHDAMDAKERPSGTQLIDRAVAVLHFLGQAGQEGSRLTEIAAAIGLSLPTAHRIVAALERHRLVERDGRGRSVRLGLALFSLGAEAADGTGLRRICRPALLRLSGATGESLFLMARSGLDTVCVDRQAGNYLLESLTRHVGGVIPLGIGSASLAVMAYLPPEEIEAVIAANTARYAAFGVSVETIRSYLAQARQNGFVVTDGLMIEGIAALAVPIRPRGGNVTAAIAINLTSARLTEAWKAHLLTLLREEIAKIEEQAGVQIASRKRP
jgi:DNA-binding IclR family transcriptional regulator